MKPLRHILFLLLPILSIYSLNAQQHNTVQNTYVYTVDEVAKQADIDTEISTEAIRNSIRWRHNIRIGYALPSLLSGLLLIDFGDEDATTGRHPYDPTLSDQLNDAHYYKGKQRMLSNLTAEYSYTFKPWLSFGAKLSYAGIWQSTRHISNDKVVSYDGQHIIGVIANVRFDWLRRRYIQLYSSIGLGVISIINHDDTTVLPLPDATYLGLSAGNKLYGYLELGGGISGSLRVGLGYRF